jgi:hypothetical protein
MKQSGMATDSQLLDLRSLMKTKDKARKKLKRLEKDAERKKRDRVDKRKRIDALKIDDPEAYAKLGKLVGSRKGGTGRPRLEEDQPELLKAIISMVSPFASAHERRRMETLPSCMTLDTLHEALKTEGTESCNHSNQHKKY